MGSAEASYLFRHAMMRLAAYDLQPPTARSELHAHAYAIIEGLPGIEQFAFELADHAHFAWLALPDAQRRREMQQREAKWLPRAIERARLGSNFLLAREYAERLIGLDVADVAARHAAILQAAEMSAMLGEMERPKELLEQADRLAQTGDDPLLDANATLCRVGTVFFPRREYQPAFDALQRARAVYRKAGNRMGEARCVGYLGNLCSSTGQREQSLEYLLEAEALFAEIGNLRGISTSKGNAGLVYKYLGQFDKAEELYREALGLDRQIGNREGISRHLGNLGVLYRDRGKLTESVRYFEEADDLFRELGDRRGAMRNALNFADCRQRQQQYHRAIADYQTAQRIADECGLGYERANAIFYRGRVLIAMKDEVRGEPVLEEAAHAYTELKAFEDAAECFTELAQCAFTRGAYDDQLRWCNAGLEARAHVRADLDDKMAFRLLSLHAQASLASSEFQNAARSAKQAIELAADDVDPILRATLKAIVQRGQPSSAT